MNNQHSESEIAAMKRTLLAAFALYLLMVLVVFCVTLSHPLANPCASPTGMPWKLPACNFSR
jgi:hypothetical protein